MIREAFELTISVMTKSGIMINQSQVCNQPLTIRTPVGSVILSARRTLFNNLPEQTSYFKGFSWSVAPTFSSF